jgi:hypothetical protein
LSLNGWPVIATTRDNASEHLSETSGLRTLDKRTYSCNPIDKLPILLKRYFKVHGSGQVFKSQRRAKRGSKIVTGKAEMAAVAWRTTFHSELSTVA